MHEQLERRLERALWPRKEQKLPKVILTFAQSLDGVIGISGGNQLRLSCSESLLVTHSIRNACDAILLGIGTVLNDSPSLTTRFSLGNSNGPLKQARPIIVDPKLECPLDAKFMSRSRCPILLACAGSYETSNRALLEEAGATIIHVPQSRTTPGVNRPRVDLAQALALISRDLGIQLIMIEGGASIIKECLTSPDIPIDLLVLTIAPVIVGAEGVRPYHLIGNNIPSLTHVEWSQVGVDAIMYANVNKIA